MKFSNPVLRVIFTAILIYMANYSFGQDFPKPMEPPRLVNDYVGVLSDTEYQNLEFKLERYEDSTSTQIAVVLIGSTGDYEISQYTVELGEKWGIGKKGKDNGILILAAIDDRQIFISTGYGLEGAVTDVATDRIIRDYVVPSFRNQDYYTGLDEATSLLIGLAEGEFKADDLRGDQSEKSPAGSLISFLFTAFLIFIFTFSRYRRLARNHYGKNSSFWAILALMMASGGGRRGSGFNDFTGGTGSFGGGGGFGGFGGGSFGGGGAGGSW